MQSTTRRTVARLVLAAVLFVLAAVLLVPAVAAPTASAASPELRAAPLSADFLEYRAEAKVRRAFGFDRVPGPRLGLIPAPMDISFLKGARIAPPTLKYASSFDLRNQGKVSPVRDQDPYGTCWTFAALASVESALLPGESRDFSEDNMALTAGFDVGGDPYNCGGNYWKSSAYLIRWGGPVDESQDAYGDGNTPPGLSAAKHVQEIHYVPGGTRGTDTSNIKYALTTWGAVATSITWDNSLYRADTAGFYYSGSANINHAVTIIGWDDNYPAGNFPSTAPGNGAWLVRNSWGTGWGQNGYFWASYYDTYCGRDSVRNAVYNGVEPAGNYADLYSYDPLGEVDSVGYGVDTAQGANVFTAKASQSISAVGFFAVVPNTRYTVYAGASLDSLTACGTGSFSTPGYYTVPLSSPLTVTSGSPFAVAVEVTTPGYGYPLACEYAEPGFSSAATASPGQSYMRKNSSKPWDDATAWKSTANVCLKAYAKAEPLDTVGPLCAAKNVTVKRGKNCRFFLKVWDELSPQVKMQLVVTTRSGGVKLRWSSTGYLESYDGWWRTGTWRCNLKKSTYLITVTGEDLDGNKASKVGRATLRVK